MSKLAGRVALVTGSGRGIGRAVALKLANEGASLVINDLDAEPAQDVVDEIVSGGGKAVSCVGSVTASDFPERFIKTALDHYGDIHIIVNNAGYTWDSVIHKMADKQFDAMYDVHVKAPFRILREAAGYFRSTAKEEAQNGQEVFRKVVNIASVAGLGGNAGQVNYSSAKSALVGMTKTLAKEWGRSKVNVNCVAFGYIETRLTQAVDEKKTIEVEGNRVEIGIPKAGIAIFKAMIPLGRAGTVEEAADGVYLFCSPESNYISGQVVTVGGGLAL
jgi:3-oxoacyl-[acyl-carrier protein] reductase